MVKKFFDQKVAFLSTTLGLDLPYFLSGGFWTFLSLTLTSVGGIFLSSLFARLWPKDVYGQYSFLVSAISFLSIFALPGMSQALIQGLAEGKEGVYKQSTKVVFKWSLVGAILLIAGSIYFFLRSNPNLAFATLLAALAFPFTSASVLYHAFNVGKRRFRRDALFTTSSQLFTILATAFALWKLPHLITVTLFATWSTAAINVLFALVTIKNIKDDRKDSGLVSLGYNLSFSQLFTISADYFDKFFVPLMLGFSNNAIFSFSILIPAYIHSLLKSATSLFQPKIATLSKKGLKKDLIFKALQMEIPLIIVVLVYILSAPKIFEYLYPAYRESAVVLSQIYSLSLLYYPGNLFSLSFIRFRLTKEILKTNIFYAVATVLSLVILVPLFGLMGAILARIVSRTAQVVIQVFLFKTKV